MRHFSEALRIYLVQKRISPSQLAEASGFEKKRVLSWLNGHSLPRYTSAIRISRVLNDRNLILLHDALYSWKVRQCYNDTHVSRNIEFKELLERLIQSFHEQVPDHELPILLEAWKKLEGKEIDEDDFNFPNEENRLVILPEPNVSILSEWKSLSSQIAGGKRSLSELDWREFEDLMAEILESSGWSITPMGYTKDNGIDIVAVKKVAPGIPIRMMVQCKRNKPSRPIGVSIVREVWSVKWEGGFHQAMIATTSTFTSGAKKKAQKWNMEIRDHDAVFDWCKQIGKAIKT